jgi:hypothetical protein
VHSPPACLYLCSAGKGRGKTHLAAALGWQALHQGRTVAFVDELGYTRRRSALPFDEIEVLVSYPADAAWLTIIDGLGEREDPPASVANTWHELINPRWLRGGWTIITSNHTPMALIDTRCPSCGSAQFPVMWFTDKMNIGTIGYGRVVRRLNEHLSRLEAV